MCGIFGVYFADQQTSVDCGRIKASLSTMEARGPDDQKFEIFLDGALALGHTRLAILDLSDNGSQPMTSYCGRYVIVINGEIYNYEYLKTVLKARGHVTSNRENDSRVFLELVACLGIEQALEICVGMFAFCILDKMTWRLYLGRDRFGEKPLYVGLCNKNLVFASDVKALSTYFKTSFSIDYNAVNNYINYSYIPDSECVFENVFKVPPSHYLPIDLRTVATTDKRSLQNDYVQYWNMDGGNVDQNIGRLSEDGCVDYFSELFNDVLSIQSFADVPVGSFLSGGIDSTLVTANLVKTVSNTVKTFSVGFEDTNFDEAHHAKKIAHLLQTDHCELYLSDSDVLDLVERLPTSFTEPHADSSQIATLAVSELAAKSVKVVLTGDGADELFGGYTRYKMAPIFWKYFGSSPEFIRLAVGNLSGWLGNSNGLKGLQPLVKQTNLNEKLLKLSRIISSSGSFEELYDYFLTAWPKTQQFLQSEHRSPLMPLEGTDLFQYMLGTDLKNYLPGDILVKVDRCSMAASLEARAPFLDHRVAAFARSLPRSTRNHAFGSKFVLRKMLSRDIPPDYFNRPKQGFGVPLRRWLGGPLFSWAESLIFDKALYQNTPLDQTQFIDTWEKFKLQQNVSNQGMWSLLMLLDWMRSPRF